MLVDVLLFVILFIISPVLALVVLAVIAVVAVIFYAALLMTALAAMVFTNLPVIILGVVMIAAAVILSTTMVFIVENLAATAVLVGNFCASVISLARDTFNSVASFFVTQEAAPVVATPVRHDGDCDIPLARAYIVPNGETARRLSCRSEGVRFFDSGETSPSAPPIAVMFPGL